LLHVVAFSKNIVDSSHHLRSGGILDLNIKNNIDISLLNDEIENESLEDEYIKNYRKEILNKIGEIETT
jgi:hypothetical protein